jgi:archaea-specific DNA-binding protein
MGSLREAIAHLIRQKSCKKLIAYKASNVKISGSSGPINIIELSRQVQEVTQASTHAKYLDDYQYFLCLEVLSRDNPNDRRTLANYRVIIIGYITNAGIILEQIKNDIGNLDLKRELVKWTSETGELMRNLKQALIPNVASTGSVDSIAPSSASDLTPPRGPSTHLGPTAQSPNNGSTHSGSHPSDLPSGPYMDIAGGQTGKYTLNIDYLRTMESGFVQKTEEFLGMSKGEISELTQYYGIKAETTSIDNWDKLINVGNKPLQTYVDSTIHYLTNNSSITIKARGSSIRKAVDVSQVVIGRLHNDGYNIGNISVGSENVGTEDGATHKVSTIGIDISKKLP